MCAFILTIYADNIKNKGNYYISIQSSPDVFFFLKRTYDAIQVPS